MKAIQVAMVSFEVILRGYVLDEDANLLLRCTLVQATQ